MRNESVSTMITEARQILSRAYAPYSDYHVGACIRTASGRLFSGVNVENAAYPLGVCAETSAICQMIAAGEQDIAEVVVLAGDDALCSPCGGCRQRLHEFSTPETLVHICNRHGVIKSMTMNELLPLAFDFSITRGTQP